MCHARTLPARPDLDWLRKAAKQRLKEFRKTRSDAKLHEAQPVVAREYRFASWRALKARIDALKGRPAMVQPLLQRGADPKATDATGATALTTTAQDSADPAMTTLLPMAGAPLDL